MNGAISALAALAQDSRLAIFRWLVVRGPQGAPAGEIGKALGLPAATLSFHLNQLKQSDLITCQRDGRSLIYSANFETMDDLLTYLTENCCGDDPAACGTDDKGALRSNDETHTSQGD